MSGVWRSVARLIRGPCEKDTRRRLADRVWENYRWPRSALRMYIRHADALCKKPARLDREYQL